KRKTSPLDIPLVQALKLQNESERRIRFRDSVKVGVERTNEPTPRCRLAEGFEVVTLLRDGHQFPDGSLKLLDFFLEAGFEGNVEKLKDQLVNLRKGIQRHLRVRSVVEPVLLGEELGD